MPAILAVLIAAAIILMSNLVFADWKANFQQNPQIATQSASPSGMAAIMGFNKIGSGSSSSSIYASPSTAKDPYEHITSNNINPLQQFGTIHESPLTSRTSTNNVDASAYTTTGNTGSTPTTRTIHPMTITSEHSPVRQQQQQNPTSTEVVTPQGPFLVTTATLSLAGQITCNDTTELLRNSKCIPSNCGPIGISQDSKCSIRPLYHHRMLMSIR